MNFSLSKEYLNNLESCLSKGRAIIKIITLLIFAALMPMKFFIFICKKCWHFWIILDLFLALATAFSLCWFALVSTLTHYLYSCDDSQTWLGLDYYCLTDRDGYFSILMIIFYIFDRSHTIFPLQWEHFVN